MHGKLFVIDGKELYLLAFNFSHVDIALSRSFAVSTREPRIVEEAGQAVRVRREAYSL